MAEEVQTLRERVTILRDTYMASFVRVGHCSYGNSGMTLQEFHQCGPPTVFAIN